MEPDLIQGNVNGEEEGKSSSGCRKGGFSIGSLLLSLYKIYGAMGTDQECIWVTDLITN